MSETRTTSILQRVPKILAVTAASYGLAQHAQGNGPAAGDKKERPRANATRKQGKPH